MKQYLEQRLGGIPVHLENNSNAMALAYKWLRPDSGDATSVLIYIRSGVRMSCIMGTALYKGHSHTAGEIGHTRVNGGSRYCPCGKQGCLDTEVSENALRVKILEGVGAGRFGPLWEMAGRKEEQVNIQLFTRSVQAGHADSLTLLDEVCGYLGDSLAQIVNMLNPSKIIFNTRYNDLGELFFSRIQQALEERAIYLALQELKLESSVFGDKTGAIGGAAIVMEQELRFVDATI